MKTTLYTLGYEKRTITEFVLLLVEAGIDVLIDVRETAWSHKPGFSKAAFRQRLAEKGIDYIHARFAGNPKALRSMAGSHEECLALYEDHITRDEAILGEFEKLVAALSAEGKRICLTCFERHPGDCHRGIIAARWSERGRRAVHHLAPTGCPRLVSA
jgi:uncharacterized protein (DUF488 family)